MDRMRWIAIPLLCISALWVSVGVWGIYMVETEQMLAPRAYEVLCGVFILGGFIFAWHGFLEVKGGE